MKRIVAFCLFALCILSFTANAQDKPAAPVDTTLSKQAAYSELKRQHDAYEDRLQASLTREQRQLQDAMKSTIVQMQTISAITAATDSTITTRKQ
jgi:hypothetical protein